MQARKCWQAVCFPRVEYQHLKSGLGCLQAGKLLSQQVLEEVRRQVEASVSREKTASLQAEALGLRDLLGPAPMALD